MGKTLKLLSKASDFPKKSNMLEAHRDAVFAVEVEQGLLLAANAAARKAWGLSEISTRWPVAIDKAMPALSELKSHLVQSDRPGATPQRLTFWTVAGVAHWRCLVTRFESADIPNLSDGPAFLITVIADTETPDQTSAAPSAPTDAATLRKIARRIREGVSAGDTLPGAISSGSQVHASAHEMHLPVTGADPTQPGSASTDVTARLAHELRTPLSAILSLADVMAEGRFGAMPNDRYKDYVISIRAAARHLVDVVDSMLTRDSVTSGRQQSTFSDVDLNQTAREVIATFGPLTEKTGVKIDIALGDGMPRVVADRQAVRQILINLLTNAINHGSQAGQPAHIVVGSGYKQGGEAWIDVSDDGPGIAPEIRERLLAAQQNVAAGASSGLGLRLSRALAETSGAQLDIGPALPTGTRARLVFSVSRVIPV